MTNILYSRVSGKKEKWKYFYQAERLQIEIKIILKKKVENLWLKILRKQILQITMNQGSIIRCHFPVNLQEKAIRLAPVTTMLRLVTLIGVTFK